MNLLLFAAMSPQEVTEKLGLSRMRDRSWYCHPSNALVGDGLFEGPLFKEKRAQLKDALFRTGLAIAKHQEQCGKVTTTFLSSSTSCVSISIWPSDLVLSFAVYP